MYPTLAGDMPPSLCELRVLENHISKGGANRRFFIVFYRLNTKEAFVGLP